MVKESSLRTEIIPAKLLSHDFSFVEGFFTGINLHKKKWLIKCSSNLHKSNIGKHFDIISGSLDTLSVNHKNIHFLVILMHLLKALQKGFVNLTLCIVPLNNLHTLEIPKTIEY